MTGSGTEEANGGFSPLEVLPDCLYTRDVLDDDGTYRTDVLDDDGTYRTDVLDDDGCPS
ncbi:hypothetical protein T484DRAFT_1800702 [Baffinella frigidus]|nr:hypothetical protein T484DRAFT_1800702 [Cryptophyta sp. CCMP2293]